jgi:hypothetical protein
MADIIGRLAARAGGLGGFSLIFFWIFGGFKRARGFLRKFGQSVTPVAL